MYGFELILKFQGIILCHTGRLNPIGREALCKELSMGERQVRELIAYNIDHDFPVCSADDKPPYGYYFPATPKEAEDCYIKDRKETITRMVRIRKMYYSTKKYYETLKEGTRQLVLI